jgi:hypothetical protein
MPAACYGGDLSVMSDLRNPLKFVRFLTRHAVSLFEILRFGFVIPKIFW